MVRKLNSFRKSFEDKRLRERLLSLCNGVEYTELPGFRHSLDHQDQETSGCCSSFRERFSELWKDWKRVSVKAMEMGRTDPRKIIFSAKMGLALILISLLIFFKEPAVKELGKYSVWAILTVVVVFEFSIGATLSKGFNRGLGTLSAGGLALAMAELSQLAGEWEEVVIVIGIFITGFLITYAKQYPAMKPYEYGFRVFLITYCFIMVSGYHTREFIETAVSRFLLIALGASISLAVNICVYPIWAGEDLHNLVTKNFINIANSLEGCISEYLNCVEYKRIPSKILTYQVADDPVYNGYRSAVESISQEEALEAFAVWEPPHGPYKMIKYPWKNYVKVSGALRYCAFMVMALHGCILSEIQAPAERRQVFRNELQRVGTASAKVLRELGEKVKKMEKLGSGDILYEVHEAAEELQKKVDRKSYLFVNAENWEIGTRATAVDISQELGSMDEDKSLLQHHRSQSETVINIDSILASKSWDNRTCNLASNNNQTTGVTPENSVGKPKFRTTHSLPKDNDALKEVEAGEDEEEEEEESKTYESASALSLATFTSLLIEFVARLQNVVDSFEELSEKAKFKDPMDLSDASQKVGLWSRFKGCIKFWKRESSLPV
ncbi:aluminum-activated malate transporter ALMT5 [Solanum lycopersicum]|uniref:Aluminum-activated malate transporter ALMT5 n=1 Tax=Solanum lycopersicum TaxID=4081 RepID=K4BMB3_SOLLC|nr:aluminum-activated malate transporter ALMT5 [Solanum lycopersicum]BAV58092.1 aluminum-activated malate transporter-like [Solanum lycopersicum]